MLAREPLAPRLERISEPAASQFPASFMIRSTESSLSVFRNLGPPKLKNITKPIGFRHANGRRPVLRWPMEVSFARHQFPPDIIRYAVWLYFRFTLRFRDVEDLLAERGLDVSYETVRRWVLKFGPLFAKELRRRRHRPTHTDGVDAPS